MAGNKKLYCMKCDRMVLRNKICDDECDVKATEVKEFLDFYDKAFGDESPLVVLTGIVNDIKEGGQ